MSRRFLSISIISLTLLIISIAWYAFSRRDQVPVQFFPATINRDCAPWDGSAFSVSIPMNDGTVINISIYQSPEINHPSTFSFPDETGQIGNGLLLLPTDSSEQLTGRVSFQRVEQGIPVEGRFDLVTEAGKQFKGKFVAEWGDEIIYCG